jgi:hypothetical protein
LLDPSARPAIGSAAADWGPACLVSYGYSGVIMGASADHRDQIMDGQRRQTRLRLETPTAAYTRYDSWEPGAHQVAGHNRGGVVGQAVAAHRRRAGMAGQRPLSGAATSRGPVARREAEHDQPEQRERDHVHDGAEQADGIEGKQLV